MAPVNYGDLAPARSKPSVDYDVQTSDRVDGTVLPQPRLRDRVQEVFERSGLFSRVQPGPGAGEYHVAIVFGGLPLEEGQRVYGVISGATACLAPLVNNETYVMVANVTKGDRPVKRYEYRERMEVFAWSPVGMVAELADTKAMDGLVDAMLLSLLRDLQHDGILETATAK